jgi:hypothetical protein
VEVFMLTLRRSRFSILPALCAALGLAPVAAAVAQDSSVTSTTHARVTTIVTAGVAKTSPIGAPGVGALGSALSVGVEAPTPLSFVRVRGEGLLSYWDADHRVAALTASLVGMAPMYTLVRPYLLAGGGAYQLPSGFGTHRGWTLGLGLEVPLARRSLRVESRMHAFDIGEGGYERLQSSQIQGIPGRWRYTYTPLSLGFSF